MLPEILDRIEERLKALGLKATAASKRAGLSEDAIRNIRRAVAKNDRQGVSTDTIIKLAPVLDTTPAWLLDGTGSESTALVRVIGYVGADASGDVIQTEAGAGYDMVPIPPGASPKALALEVRGNSMPNVAPSGSLVFFETQRAPDADLLNQDVVAELEDGRVLLKRLHKGQKPGTWSLYSEDGEPIQDVRLRWASDLIAIILPKQAARIIRRAA